VIRLDQDAFESALAVIVPEWRSRRHCVALSGGLDSTVLLDLVAAAGPAGLRACHVDHGLHAASADWREFCARRCEALGVAYTAVKVRVPSIPGESPEAAAREARYAVLRDGLREGEILLCAHHADDQAETVLLQLLRGGGPAGLAAMPALKRWGPGWLCRPLLAFERDALRACAERRGLRWIEDPSNADPGADRNYVRHRVLPILRDRWPGLAATLGRSARHSAAAAGIVEERAAEDLAGCALGATVNLGPLRALSAERQRQVLRQWIRARGLPLPDSRRLETLRTDLVEGRSGSGGQVDWNGAGVRRFRDRLYLLEAAAIRRLSRPPPSRPWPEPAPLPLGDGLGTLLAEPVSGEGLAASLFGPRGLEVRWRRGGERIRPAPAARRRRLKSLLREAGVLPWMRDRVPLIYADGDLVAVGDLWLSGDWRAGSGEPGYRIRWSGRPPLL
jgi:tRNA(Ile)-lysidine synthase